MRLGLAPSLDDEDDAGALLARADQVMYDAKSRGPGLFAVATGNGPSPVVPKSTDAGDTTS